MSLVDKNMKLFDGITANAKDTTKAVRNICNPQADTKSSLSASFILKDGKAELVSRTDNSFMCEDVKELMKNKDIQGNIIHILNYDSAQEKKYFNLDSFCSMFSSDTVILTTAYVSIEEFPEDEWYFDKPEPGLKKIPVDDIIERECKLLEAVGFININKLVGYESKEAYVYGNEVGRKIAVIANAL